MDNGMEALQKIKNKGIIWPSNSFLGIYLKNYNNLLLRLFSLSKLLNFTFLSLLLNTCIMYVYTLK